MRLAPVLGILGVVGAVPGDKVRVLLLFAPLCLDRAAIGGVEARISLFPGLGRETALLAYGESLLRGGMLRQWSRHDSEARRKDAEEREEQRESVLLTLVQNGKQE